MTAETADVPSELVVPLWMGDELIGALNLEEVRHGAFDEDDARLVRTIADQIGSALRSATLFERLESGYLGTAEALAAALEAKDSYTAEHPRAVVEQACRVGAELELSEVELQTLRLVAILHDVGKLAVPEAILNKREPLTDAERVEIERHTVVGRAHPGARRLPRRRAAAGAPRARAVGWARLPGWPLRRGDPAGLAHHPRLRRL
ncbi:MAG: HD-GYP domain-containing protein [Thermoleophilaceae bacterium]